MRPGEIESRGPPIRLNDDRPVTELEVRNDSAWPIGVGSHFHFFEANSRLRFDRERAYGMRLDSPAGSITWFPRGESRVVRLIPVAGARRIRGFSGLVDGSLSERKEEALEAARGRAGRLEGDDHAD